MLKQKIFFSPKKKSKNVWIKRLGFEYFSVIMPPAAYEKFIQLVENEEPMAEKRKVIFRNPQRCKNELMGAVSFRRGGCYIFLTRGAVGFSNAVF